jgi:hypothetical protein
VIGISKVFHEDKKEAFEKLFPPKKLIYLKIKLSKNGPFPNLVNKVHPQYFFVLTPTSNILSPFSDINFTFKIWKI